MGEGIFDLSHVVFMDLIRTLIKTTGVEPAKGNLIRIAINAGEQMQEMSYNSFDEFVASFDKLANPVSRIEGQAVHVGNGIFGLKQCPFSPLVKTYIGFYGESPKNFVALTDEFNKQSRINKEYNIGAGAAVGPFCVFHQPIRSAIAGRIKIGSKQLEIMQLGCKSGNGTKAFSDAMIASFGTTREVVDKVLDDYVCCYGVHEKQAAA
jgi:hypothetical protein